MLGFVVEKCFFGCKTYVYYFVACLGLYLGSSVVWAAIE